MEDQQPDTGDLTTDATDATEPAPDDDQAAEAASVTSPRKPRRAHRMPIGKARKAANPPAEPVASKPNGQPDAATETDAVTAATSGDDQPAIDDAQSTEATPEAESDAASQAAPDDETDDETADVESGADTAESAADEPTLVAHRPAGKRLKIAAVSAAALFVVAAAFAGATVQPFLVDRALVQTKLDVARTAANGITTLWTYTPDDMDKLPDRSARYLGGAFEADYRKYVDAIAPTNKQAKVSNNTQVLGTAVESLTPSEATALVYTNSTSTSPVTKNIPSMRYVSYRLSMERHDARWLITRMTTITSLDLTPQL